MCVLARACGDDLCYVYNAVNSIATFIKYTAISYLYAFQKSVVYSAWHSSTILPFSVVHSECHFIKSELQYRMFRPSFSLSFFIEVTAQNFCPIFFSSSLLGLSAP